MLSRTYLAVVLAFVAVPLWSQSDSTGAQPAASGSMESDDRMATPTPVSGEGYSLAFASETPRSNYLRGGLTFGSAYDDNILGSSTLGISDVSYSVWPSISLNQSRSRLRWDLTYRPGFTFYQHNTSHNEADQNLTLGFEYRLSPNVTVSLRDSFQKTSNSLNLSNQDTNTSTSGVVQSPNNSIVPPLTDLISNFGNVEITYQFGLNEMVGAKGTLSGLWYPNRNEVPGLFGSTAEAGEAFYTHRLSGRHYIGATYQFQNLQAQPQSNWYTNSQHAFLLHSVSATRIVGVTFYRAGIRAHKQSKRVCAGYVVTSCWRQPRMAGLLHQFCRELLAQNNRGWRFGGGGPLEQRRCFRSLATGQDCDRRLGSELHCQYPCRGVVVG